MDQVQQSDNEQRPSRDVLNVLFVLVSLIWPDGEESFEDRGAEVKQEGDTVVGCVQVDPESPSLVGTSYIQKEQESGGYEAEHGHEHDPALNLGVGHLGPGDQDPHQASKDRLEDEEQVREGGEDRATPGQPAPARSCSGAHAAALARASKGDLLTDRLLREPRGRVALRASARAESRDLEVLRRGAWAAAAGPPPPP